MPPAVVSSTLSRCLAAVCLSAIVSCGGGSGGPGPGPRANLAPRADAGADREVDEQQVVTLDGAAFDADGRVIAVQWRQTGGPSADISDADTVTASVLTPVTTEVVTLVFQLTVTDDEGSSAVDSVSITVMPVNAVPTAIAGGDRTVFSGDTVVLDGDGNDSDGSIERMQWTQTLGPPVALAGAEMPSANFLAPDVTAELSLVFSLLVTDNEGGVGTAVVTILVLPRLSAVVSAPDIAPPGGDFTTEVTVTLTSELNEALIYYTLDGSMPTRESSVYLGPFALAASATVRAVAVQEGLLDSPVRSAEFRIDEHAGPSGPPNILVFLADDMGWGDAAAYNPDSKIPTPNIDALAAAGMRFTDAHTSAAKCAPTRYSAITGNYQWRGLESWGTWNYKGEAQILPGQWSLGDLLQQEGYNTALVGKLHLGGEFYKKGSNQFASRSDPDDVVDFSRAFEFGPRDYGFDFSYVLLRGIQDSPYAYFRNNLLVGNPNDMVSWLPGAYSGSIINTAGPGTPDYSSKQAGPRLARQAIDFLDRHHRQNLDTGSDRPFFLYYASQSAHGPYTPPETFLGEPVKGVTGIETHSDMIYEIDVALGKLVEAIMERGLLDDTLIIFTSDNGGLLRSLEIEAGHDAVGGLRGQKGRIWEGGHRVPFIARWGDGSAAGSMIAPGSIRQELIGVQDLMATFAALFGKSLPYDQGRDSFDILPILLGQTSSQQAIRDHIILQADRGEELWAYRQGNWKLVMDRSYRPTDLYDLAVDIGETTDRLGDPDQAVRAADMHARFLERRASDRTAPLPDSAP